MILGSNLIILSVAPAYPGLRRLITSQPASASDVSRLEVLGYHRMTPIDLASFQQIFARIALIPITRAVIDRAVQLRQSRKMSVGDAIIAGTALETGDELWTHNVRDFHWVPGLRITDPLANGDPP